MFPSSQVSPFIYPFAGRKSATTYGTFETPLEIGEKKNNLPLVGATLAVNCLSFAAGNAYSWTSPVLPKLDGKVEASNNPFPMPITPFQESLVVSLMSLGATLGPFVGGATVDRLGRKKPLILVAIPIIISYSITAFATSIEYYYVARFLLGLGIGCVYSIVPMYVGEISEDSNRGALGCIMNTMSTLGTLTCFGIGPYISIKLLSLLCIVPVATFLVTFNVFAPESAYFLILVDKNHEATSALKRVRIGAIEKELEEITRNVEDCKCDPIKFKDLFKSNAIFKGLIIGVGLMFFQQFSGISVVIAYMQSIFQAAESKISAEISSIFVAFVQLIANLLTFHLVDKIGRKILIVGSLIGAFFSHVSLGVYFHLQSNGVDVSPIFWLPIASLMVYVVSFNIGIGPVIWAMMGELFPPHFKSVAATVTSVTCLLSAFILTVFYPNLRDVIGMAKTFWLFGAFSVLGAIFVVLVVPETKGKSLLEIQTILNQGERSGQY